jgi:hypothetical protein
MTHPTDRDRDAACAAVNIAAAAKEPPAAGSQAEAIDVLKKLNAQGDAELTKARADLDTARMSAIEAKEITRELRLTLAGVDAVEADMRADVATFNSSTHWADRLAAARRGGE